MIPPSLFFVIMILAHLHGRGMNTSIKIFLNAELVALRGPFAAAPSVQIRATVTTIVSLNELLPRLIVIAGRSVHARR